MIVTVVAVVVVKVVEVAEVVIEVKNNDMYKAIHSSLTNKKGNSWKVLRFLKVQLPENINTSPEAQTHLYSVTNPSVRESP